MGEDASFLGTMHQRTLRSLAVPGARVCLVVTALLMWSAPALAQPAEYDHVHLVVPDVGAAVRWYTEQMGGTPVRSGQVAFGSTLLMFRAATAAAPSAGSVIDHIGFSFHDLEARMRSWQAAGVKVTSPLRDVEGLFKLAFVEDPWGVKVEVVQDAETLGFHHIHLFATDPQKMLDWLSTSFGGGRSKLKGRIDGIRHGSLWLLVRKAEGPVAPSAGRAIDHLGWRFKDVRAAAASLKGGGVTFTREPSELPVEAVERTGVTHVAFLQGPEGLNVELAQRR
jgi:catechol 2,3-dioxygenase-like lactoylglutathione lyase family enzyme